MSPTTRAGKALADNFSGSTSVAVEVRRLVAAIESEARQQEREALAERIEGLPNPWPFPYIGDVKRGPCGQSVEDFRAAVLAILLDPRETGG